MQYPTNHKWSQQTSQGSYISFRVLTNSYGFQQTITGSYRPLRVHTDNLKSIQSLQRHYELITAPRDLKIFPQTTRVLQACWKYSNRSYTRFFHTLQGPYTDVSKSLHDPHGFYPSKSLQTPHSSNRSFKIPTLQQTLSESIEIFQSPYKPF